MPFFVSCITIQSKAAQSEQAIWIFNEIMQSTFQYHVQNHLNIEL